VENQSQNTPKTPGLTQWYLHLPAFLLFKPDLILLIHPRLPALPLFFFVTVAGCNRLTPHSAAFTTCKGTKLLFEKFQFVHYVKSIRDITERTNTILCSYKKHISYLPMLESATVMPA